MGIVTDHRTDGKKLFSQMKDYIYENKSWKKNNNS